jgi:hypothetical protein
VQVVRIVQLLRHSRATFSVPGRPAPVLRRP